MIANPVEAVEALAAARQPYLIGIRHHSPVLAAAVPRLLDGLSPDLLLVELPADLQAWLPWLAAEDARAPLALAASRRDGRGLVFYPFADFSPELAAVRWARQHDIPVEAFDLPLSLVTDDSPRGRTRLAPEHPAPLSDALRRMVQADDADELWDRTVEVRAPGAEPEAIRRAALAVGWSLRFEQATWGEVPPGDLLRERWMRERLRAALERGVQRPAAVVGTFHAAAVLEAHEAGKPWPKPADVVTSLVAYAFELLDSRTGYPAGIRDPEWQQVVWRSNGSTDAIARAVSSASVRVCRELRASGHPAGVPDAREAARVAIDLARLRDLPAPGRRELVEGLQSALAQGEPFGRGRAVAAAMQTVLVGTRRGRLARGTPRSGLGPHVEELLAELRLPRPDQPGPIDIRLDPLRSRLDRRRHVAIQRLLACQVPYAIPISADPDLLTGRWVLRWQPATAARLDLCSSRGVTLRQAAEGTLRARFARADSADRVTVRLRLDTLGAAAECGLRELSLERLEDLEVVLPREATVDELVQALDLCDRLARGHIPGLEPTDDLRQRLTRRVQPVLNSAAVAAIEGLAGAQRAEDATSLLAVAQRLERDKSADGDLRLRSALAALEREGSPLMQGAAGAVRVLLNHLDVEAFAARLGSWIDADHTTLARRLVGTLTVAGPLLEAAPAIADQLILRIAAMDDAFFLQRLPALREGFDALSPAARQRFLEALRPQLATGFDVRIEHARETLARWAAADLRARQALLEVLPSALEQRA